jgi:plastocyanin
MRKDVASVGLILVFIAAVLFYIVFSGGQFLGITVTGTNATANFIAFFYVIAALPIGCGLAYFGLSIRTPTYAAGGPTQVVYRSSRVGSAAIAVAVIALIIAFAAIGLMYSNSSTQSSNLNSVSSQVSSINSKLSNVATVNVAPSTVAFKVDWCNTDNTGQDRFCPGNIVVNQGDVVQILFMHNDTDAHTFTLDTAPYFFQINDSSAGMHNFVTNAFNSGNCSNTATIAQQQAAVSDIYCVSGNSLLSPAELQSHGATDFVVAQNPDPALPISNDSGPIILKVDNTVHFNSLSGVSGNGTDGVWGIGAFQATTPGIYEYFCHYHVSNGMFGYLIVLPNAYCTSNPSACGSNSTTT